MWRPGVMIGEDFGGRFRNDGHKEAALHPSELK